jgi:hypothetical protein
LIPASLLYCACTPPGYYKCVCTDPEGNKSFVMQNGPCDQQPMGSGIICTSADLQAGTGGADGGGGAGGGGGADGGH